MERTTAVVDGKTWTKDDFRGLQQKHRTEEDRIAKALAEPLPDLKMLQPMRFKTSFIPTNPRMTGVLLLPGQVQRDYVNGIKPSIKGDYTVINEAGYGSTYQTLDQLLQEWEPRPVVLADPTAVTLTLPRDVAQTLADVTMHIVEHRQCSRRGQIEQAAATLRAHGIEGAYPRSRGWFLLDGAITFRN